MKKATEAKAAASPPRVMDLEDFEDLEQVLAKAAVAERGTLTTFQTKFAIDIAERLSKFGQRLRISIKQWEVIRGIAGNLGVELQP